MSDEQIIDKVAFESLKDALRERFNKISLLFIEQTPIKMANLKEKVREKDGEGVKQVAHSLKGSCANFCAVGMAATFKEIEQLGLDSKFEAIEEYIKKAEDQFDQVKTILHREIENNPD